MLVEARDVLLTRAQNELAYTIENRLRLDDLAELIDHEPEQALYYIRNRIAGAEASLRNVAELVRLAATK